MLTLFFSLAAVPVNRSRRLTTCACPHLSAMRTANERPSVSCCCVPERQCAVSACDRRIAQRQSRCAPHTPAAAVAELRAVPLLLLLLGCPHLLAVALKPDVFEGLRFELSRPLNQNFFLTHRFVDTIVCSGVSAVQRMCHPLHGLPRPCTSNCGLVSNCLQHTAALLAAAAAATPHHL